MEETKNGINVSPSSTEGHFIKNAEKVITLDEINETFHVKGKSKLVTKNHTTIVNNDECLITCQQVYNPLEGVFEKSRD